jgi:hypothetical protein
MNDDVISTLLCYNSSRSGLRVLSIKPYNHYYFRISHCTSLMAHDIPAADSGYHDHDSEFSSDDEQHFHVDERSGRSFPSRLLHSVIKPIKPKLVEFGQVSSADPTRCKPSRGARKRCDVEERKIEGVWTYDLTPTSPNGERRSYARRILYFAGGGWQAPPTGQIPCIPCVQSILT